MYEVSRPSRKQRMLEGKILFFFSRIFRISQPHAEILRFGIRRDVQHATCGKQHADGKQKK
jgi:hypothetical protein